MTINNTQICHALDSKRPELAELLQTKNREHSIPIIIGRTPFRILLNSKGLFSAEFFTEHQQNSNPGDLLALNTYLHIESFHSQFNQP